MNPPFFSSDDPGFSEHGCEYKGLYKPRHIPKVSSSLFSGGKTTTGLVFTQTFERIPHGYHAVQFANLTDRMLCFRVLECLNGPAGTWIIHKDWEIATPLEDTHYRKCLQFMDFPQILEYSAESE